MPYPHAVDDHQTTNAAFLVNQGGGWLVQQRELNAEKLADMLQKTERLALVKYGSTAKTMQKIEATSHLVSACEALAS